MSEINKKERDIGAILILETVLDILSARYDELEEGEEFKAGFSFVGTLLEYVHEGLVGRISDDESN